MGCIVSTNNKERYKDTKNNVAMTKQCIQPQLDQKRDVSNQNTIKEHQDNPGSKQILSKDIDKYERVSDGKQCKWCFNGFGEVVQDHNCHQKKYAFEQIQKDNSLSTLQREALISIYNTSVVKNYNCYIEALEKLSSVSFSEESYSEITQYIQDRAPIIIHFNLSKSIKHFIQDTHYRNLFQTNMSGGSTSKQNRKLWEKHLFGSCYDGASDFERVKYGVMNLTNDRRGLSLCKQYGSSYMILNYTVRNRCTISHTRTYKQGEIVGPLKYCNPVLCNLTAGQLQALHFSSKGFQIESQQLTTFKEIQIHGQISFFKNVECIYAPQEEIDSNILEVTSFVDIFNVPIMPIVN